MEQQSKPLDSCISISIREAARATGLCTGVLHREVKQGKLVARVYSRRTLIEVTELKRWVASLPTKRVK